MTIPLEYARASADFDRFTEELRVALDHTTRHQTYQTIESVLRVFRRRLDTREAIIFAGALPAVLRAVFVTDWDLDEPRRPFADRRELAAEVKDFRRDHDFSPDDAIAQVAAILRRHVDPIAFARTLSRLPPGAVAFWAPETSA